MVSEIKIYASELKGEMICNHVPISLVTARKPGIQHKSLLSLNPQYCSRLINIKFLDNTMKYFLHIEDRCSSRPALQCVSFITTFSWPPPQKTTCVLDYSNQDQFHFNLSLKIISKQIFQTRSIYPSSPTQEHGYLWSLISNGWCLRDAPVLLCVQYCTSIRTMHLS